MTDRTATCTYTQNVIGNLKIIAIQTPAATDTGTTIDLYSDNAGISKIKTILVTVLQDDVGADKTSTWDPATGIITLGTLVTGVHGLVVVGL